VLPIISIKIDHVLPDCTIKFSFSIIALSNESLKYLSRDLTVSGLVRRKVYLKVLIPDHVVIKKFQELSFEFLFADLFLFRYLEFTPEKSQVVNYMFLAFA